MQAIYLMTMTTTQQLLGHLLQGQQHIQDKGSSSKYMLKINHMEVAISNMKRQSKVVVGTYLQLSTAIIINNIQIEIIQS